MLRHRTSEREHMDDPVNDVDDGRYGPHLASAHDDVGSGDDPGRVGGPLRSSPPRLWLWLAAWAIHPPWRRCWCAAPVLWSRQPSATTRRWSWPSWPTAAMIPPSCSGLNSSPACLPSRSATCTRMWMGSRKGNDWPTSWVSPPCAGPSRCTGPSRIVALDGSRRPKGLDARPWRSVRPPASRMPAISSTATACTGSVTTRDGSTNWSSTSSGRWPAPVPRR